MSKKITKWEKIANEFVVSLFPVYGLINSLFFQYKKKIGKSAALLIVIKQQALTYYMKPLNWNSIHLAIVKKVENNEEFLIKVLNQIKSVGRLQIKNLNKTLDKLSKINNIQLNKIYQNYIKSNELMYFYGTLISFLDFQDTTYFTEQTKKILNKYKLNNCFESITTPLSDTYNKQQEISLLQIYKDLKKEKKIQVVLEKENSVLLYNLLKNLYKKLFLRLQDHTKKYCWVNYVYEGPAADIFYFLEIIISMYKRKVNPFIELNLISKEKEKIEKIHNILLKDKRFTKQERYIIKNVSQIVFYKPFRRELQSHSYYLFENVLKEISKRLFLSIGQVRMMTAKELSSALLKNKININLLNQRINHLVYFIQDNKEVCLSGERALKYIKRNIIKEKKVKVVKLLQGNCAYAGKVRGLIKIINTPADMKKMNDGDILLACTTNPNLMPAIRKAKAIITDEGGLTCHAAIVSREMRIPCVIGTKIATQVLKDGDRVEVDANKGVVKKMVNKKGG